MGGRIHVFRGAGKGVFRPIRTPSRRSVRGLVEGEALGVVAQPVDGGLGQQPVTGEGLVPLGEVEVAGYDGGSTLVALGDEVVQILVGGGTKGFDAEVVD